MGDEVQERRSGFWSTLPGILTGSAALITAATGGYLAFHSGGQSPSAAAANLAAPAALAETPASAEPANAAAATPARPGEVQATVVDPDGWTNLRAAPSAASAIVGKIEEGEIFWTRPRNSLWWPARTEDGLKGYVHRSRVRLNP
jgi:hypothetical protein